MREIQVNHLSIQDNKYAIYKDKLLALTNNDYSSDERSIKRISSGTKQIQFIIDHIDYMSTTESFSNKVNSKNINIIEFSRFLFESFRNLANQNEIRWNFKSNWQDITFNVNESVLKRILENLLSFVISNYAEESSVYMSLRPLFKSVVIEVAVHSQKENLLEEKNAFKLVFIEQLVQTLGYSFSIEKKTKNITSYTIKLGIEIQELRSNYHLKQNEESSVKRTALVIESVKGASLNLLHYSSNDFQFVFSANTLADVKSNMSCNPDVIIYDNARPTKETVNILLTLKLNKEYEQIPVLATYNKSIVHNDNIENLLQYADAQLCTPYTEGEFKVIIDNLMGKIVSKKISRNDNRPSDEFPLLQKVYHIINENIANSSFSVPDLCKLTQVSKSQLHRKLKSTSGYSAIQLIRLIRLTKAKQILKRTPLPIKEVANQSGFIDPAYFTRVFLKEYGYTPSQFRKRNI